jgi:arylsulfatase A-like enzyme
VRFGKLYGIGAFALLVVVRTGLCGEPASASLNSERHVVVVVWDGMRADQVTVQNAPTLWNLAQKGVIFRNHHAVYPSATHVNGTAIETGMYPQDSGLIANYDFRPDIDPEKFISTEQENVIAKGDKLSRGKYLSVPTLPELIRKAGGKTVVASAKTIGFLLDRQSDHGTGQQGVTISAGESLPASVASSLEQTDGAFPGFPIYSHEQRDAWTTAALTQTLWKDGVPAFSLLWLGEPDLTQHETAPGAPAARAAIKSADENLATVLAALEQKGVRDKTDIFIVSDHGFSTISHAHDLEKYLKQAGLAATVSPKEWVKPGQIMLVANGGTVLFYVNGHDGSVTDRLIERLQQSDFAGVILTKKEKPGTFPLSKVMIDTPHSPDVVVAFRWTQEPNQYGVPGMIEADWSRQAGKGTHATLSCYDMHNILFAAGPDFRESAVDDLPTGNVDLAPTILKILGINPAPKMDGRVLSEMMKGSEASPVPKPSSDTVEASRDFPNGTWRQYLQQSKVGNTLYLDEGNGAFTARDQK